VYERENFKIAVINILGQAGFERVHLSNPFLLLPEIVNKVSQQTNIIIVDYHASTTAEKNSMFLYMDGKVSAVFGTHTKAISADERILPGGTAIMTDAGRTGSIDSVGGLDPEIEIRKFITQIPEYSKECWEGLELQGAIVEIGENGKAISITRLRVKYEGELDERDSGSE